MIFIDVKVFHDLFVCIDFLNGDFYELVVLEMFGFWDTNLVAFDFEDFSICHCGVFYGLGLSFNVLCRTNRRKVGRDD